MRCATTVKCRCFRLNAAPRRVREKCMGRIPPAVLKDRGGGPGKGDTATAPRRCAKPSLSRPVPNHPRQGAAVYRAPLVWSSFDGAAPMESGSA